VAPAFDKSDEFALDKPACTACPNLDEDDICMVHNRLEKAGFRGCVLYDCLGAGQRVVQELYPGRSWREEPELLDEMWSALTALRGVHELILLLATAAKAPLSGEERRMLEALQAELEPAGGWTAVGVQAFATGPTPRSVSAFLRSLRAHFSR
jgi:hypothetical protein